MMFTLAAFLARLLLFNNVFASPTHDTFDPSAGNSREILSRALIIDVDNTLYSERALRVRGRGIEEQIVSNTHHFCASRLNMTKEEADDLFRKYGSTVEGLRQTLPREDVEQILIDYYHQVWSDNIDYSSLLPFQKLDGKHGTGYSHESATRSLQELLERIGLPITFASNSPSWHVHKVLKSLGLCKVQNHGILAPDTTSCVELMYPTKARPDIFYRSILPQLEEKNFVLLDDSAYNVKEATKHGIEGIKVDESGLERSLGEALGHVDRGFVFSESEYLKAKNQVDAKSINTNVWSELARNVKLQKDSILRIADLGAGRLFMLEMLLQDSGHTPPLVDLIPGNVRGIEYHAYESNRRLYRVCHETLSQLGFREEPQSDEPKEGDVNVFLNAAKNVMVHLHWYEYETEVMDLNRGFTPDVIVGCCFADLVSPSELVTGVKRFVQKMKASHEVLVYFPITFSGTTQLLPPQPYQKSHGQKWIPSDTEAFRVYSKALAEEHGHNVEPERLIDEFERHGGELLCQGKSNWVIDKKENNALWETMLYFFGMVAAPRLLKNGFDSLGWVQRSRNCPVTIEVSNIDLLFRLEAPLRQSELNVEPTNKDLMELEEIQFTAPYEVGTVKRSIRRDLAPNQVLIRTDYSLVSSGTELKIFRGMFDDAALDVNIKGMAEKRLSYPLSYGYSLVGHVVQVGPNVSKDLVGKLVFTFSPHASHVITSRSAIQLVPEHVSARDAIFMPSVETALSLIHDAQLRIGENVAIFGQGLIGLLVTAILATTKSSLDAQTGEFGTITTFDSIPDRLAMSAAMGASQALLPSHHAKAFDVSIEVSGNSQALQSAIDSTRPGGRVIVGSWYGNTDVTLKLGMDFHRSHITLQTSQVSEIPASLRMLWSKERRFALSWQMVKLIRPSRLLTKTTTLSCSKEAYESLDRGNDISVCFHYPNYN